MNPEFEHLEGDPKMRPTVVANMMDMTEWPDDRFVGIVPSVIIRAARVIFLRWRADR